jgi:K(+)-stimulated pyrophosphate-energized sodium pump
MSHPMLFAEGGYQAYTMSSTDKAWLFVVLAIGLVGIFTGLFLMRSVLATDQGSMTMREIAKAIQEGAEAFLARQFRTIAIIVVPLAVLIFFTGTQVIRPNGSIAMSASVNGLWRVVCFLIGATFSGTVGFIGMSTAVRGNVRTAAAAAAVGPNRAANALRVAFRTGAVTGLLCVGLGLTGAAGIFLVFQNSATAVLVGFAESSPRQPTSAPIWSERSRRAFPRTTRETPRRSPTTSATTSATARGWRPTSLSPTSSP